MKKSLYSQEQTVLQGLLRKLRNDQGLLQEDVAAKLMTYQTFVSKYESGERILDFPEIRQVCHVFGLTLPEFAAMFEDALTKSSDDISSTER